jgi:hypothetical protein
MSSDLSSFSLKTAALKLLNLRESPQMPSLLLILDRDRSTTDLMATKVMIMMAMILDLSRRMPRPMRRK